MSSVHWRLYSAHANDGIVLSASFATEDGKWEAYLKNDGCFDLCESGGHEDAFSIHLCEGLHSLDELIRRLQNLRSAAIKEIGASSDEWSDERSVDVL